MSDVDGWVETREAAGDALWLDDEPPQGLLHASVADRERE
jgi:hypothetical protein